jgi:hypothetical protein
MPPHAHGGDEDEPVIVVRTDGPPFVDLKAKQGEGFEVDFEKVGKYIGAGKLTLSEFARDMEAINKAYVPVVQRCGWYMKAGSAGMLGAFAVFILLGIVGGTPELRSAVMPLCMCLFLAGAASFTYSKWIEQPALKEGAAIVKRIIDEEVNPRYIDSRFRVRWAVRVYMQKATTMHMGKQFVEQPIVSIYTLRSPDANGTLTDWMLPEAFLSGLFVDVAATLSEESDEVAEEKLAEEEDKT